MPSSQRNLADVAVALLVALAATALFAATTFERVFGGDGKFLAESIAWLDRSWPSYHNTLYLPAAQAYAALAPRGLLAAGDDPLAVGKSLSALAAGIGVACSFLVCRLLGAARWAALAGVAMVAFAPGLWFFGAAIEVHAQHFATVAACALATILLPWRRPVLAAAAAAVVFVIPSLSHQTSPLLGPGWILLVQCARRRVGAAFSWPALFAVGVALLLAVGLGHVLVQWRRGLGLGADPAGLAATVSAWHRGFSPQLVMSEVVEPLFLIVPVAVVACSWRAIDPWLRACGALIVSLPIFGVLWWGIAERGGYLLGGAFVFAVLAARLWSAMPRRLAVGSAALAVAVQAWAGWRYVEEYAAGGLRVEDRVALVRSNLAAGGVLLACNDNGPSVELWLTDRREYDLRPSLVLGWSQEEWFATVRRQVTGFLGAGSVALDVSYRNHSELAPGVRDRMSQLEAALRQDCRVTEIADPSWPMLLLARR